MAKEGVSWSIYSKTATYRMTGFRSRFGTVVILAALCPTFGCSTTATLRRRSGPDIEGTIVRSDDQALYTDTNAGQRFRIERTDVREIDHPGNVTAVVGLSLIAIGIGLLMAIDQSTDKSDPARGEMQSGFAVIPAVLALECLIVSVPMTLIGGNTYGNSVSAANPPGQHKRTLQRP